jgi:hypothetical protein
VGVSPPRRRVRRDRPWETSFGLVLQSVLHQYHPPRLSFHPFRSTRSSTTRIMAIVEEVSEENHTGRPGPSSAGELLRVVQELSKRLALPEDLLPSFLSEDKRECGGTLRFSQLVLPGRNSGGS